MHTTIRSLYTTWMKAFESNVTPKPHWTKEILSPIIQKHCETNQLAAKFSRLSEDSSRIRVNFLNADKKIVSSFIFEPNLYQEVDEPIIYMIYQSADLEMSNGEHLDSTNLEHTDHFIGLPNDDDIDSLQLLDIYHAGSQAVNSDVDLSLSKENQ